MFNKSNHKVENFNWKLKKKNQMKIQELKKKINLQYEATSSRLFIHRKQHRKENRECGI